MLFSDYLMENEGNAYEMPFSTFLDYRYEKVLSSMLSDDIQDKTNVLNYFVYNNILTHILATATQGIDIYLSKVLLFKDIEKIEFNNNFYIPKMLGGKEFKTILKRPDNLVKEYVKSKSLSGCNVKVINGAPNRKGITASSLTFVKIFGEYAPPETSGLREDIRNRIRDTISECFKEALTSAKLNYLREVQPKTKTGSFEIPHLEPLDHIEMDWSEDDCFKYSINLNLCNK